SSVYVLRLAPLLLHLDMEPRLIERLDQRRRVEVARHREGVDPGLGGVARHALDLLDRRLDRLAARRATVVDAGQRQALDLAGAGPAVGLHGQVLVAALAVEPRRRQGVQRLLGRLVVPGRQRDRPGLPVAHPLDAIHLLQDVADYLDALTAAQVD